MVRLSLQSEKNEAKDCGIMGVSIAGKHE